MWGETAKDRGNPGSYGGREEGEKSPEVPVSQKQ